MVVKITIDDKAGHTVYQNEFANDSQFYLGAIDKDGRYASFGVANPRGKGYVKGIRKWAHEWAREQNLNEFFQELRKVLIECSVKAGNVQAQLALQADTFFFDPDQLQSFLMEVKMEVSRAFQQTCGREGGFLFFHAVWEMLLAMVSRLREESKEVHTVWEYPALPLVKGDVEAVLEWLFRRV